MKNILFKTRKVYIMVVLHNKRRCLWWATFKNQLPSSAHSQ